MAIGGGHSSWASGCLITLPAHWAFHGLGPIYAHVKFKVSGIVCDPNYRVRDGDASFLDPGTPIYQIIGYPPSEQLAARFNGRLVPFRTLPPA